MADMSGEEWATDQLKPLSMFELAKWWMDGIKLIGAGNAAGLLAAGASLSTIQSRPLTLVLVKIAGAIFFAGVFAFAVGAAKVHMAVFAQDEVAHAVQLKDVAEIRANSKRSTESMTQANWLAIVGAAAFFVGCVVGLAAFLSF